MSAFLALTLKSSRKSASLRKGNRDPCTYVWTDRKNFKRCACFKTRCGTGIRLAVLGGKVCPLGCLEKACIRSPFLRSCQNTRGVKDPISTSITLSWWFLFLSFSCSTKIDSVDLFWLHVKFTCVRHTSKNAVSPSDQKLPAFMSSLASGLVTVDLRLNTSLAIGRRWGFTLTSLQTLLSRDVRRFWMPYCLCATKPTFLHDRVWLTVNRSPHVQWLGKIVMQV